MGAMNVMCPLSAWRVTSIVSVMIVMIVMIVVAFNSVMRVINV